MTISLYDEEVELLLMALPNLRGGASWVKQGLIKKIESEQALIAENRLCSHREGHYSGKKVCCTRCLSYFEKGQGEEWTLDQ